MDYVSHGVWSYIFFHRIKRPIYAVLFGLLPDTMSWAIYAVYRMFIGMKFAKPILPQIPEWTFVLYGISHSLVVVGVVILLIYIIMRRVPVYVFAWPIAIVMDLFTHTREFLPTPFLWPISNWKFPGISWGTRWFIITNLALMIICLSVIVYNRRRQSLPAGNPD